MTEDQREAWRKALAAKAKAGRRQRYQPRKGTYSTSAGMLRIPAARKESRHAPPPQRPG